MSLIYINPYIFTTVQSGPGSGVPLSGLKIYLDASDPNSYPSPYNGTTWFDLSGNGYNGNLSGNSTYSPDFGGYISFGGGGSDYAAFSNYTQPEITPTGSFTWSIFFRIFESTDDVIMGNRYPAPFIKLTPKAFEYPAIKFDYVLPQNEWMHVCFVKNGFNFTYYKNTVSVKTGFNDWYTNSAGSPFYLGGDPGYGEMTTCHIGQALVYEVALNASEVTQIFDASRTRFGI